MVLPTDPTSGTFPAPFPAPHGDSQESLAAIRELLSLIRELIDRLEDRIEHLEKD
jgi:hypothetical protein